MRKAFLFLGMMVVAALSMLAVQPAHGSAQGKVPVIITFVDRPGPPDQALVRGAGGDIKYTYHLVPAIAASVPQGAIAGLARNPRITRIDPDLEIHIADHSEELNNTWGVAHIGGGDAHHEGFQGSSVRVAVLDSGIDRDHPDLAHDPGCSDPTSYPSIHDGNSHGTHVAGTVAALKNQVGVVGAAPAATLCVFKVLSDGGGGNYSDVIKALEVIDQYNQDNPDPIRVANHSYGSSGDPGPTVKAAFDLTYQGGVLHVGAAGNSGNPPGRGDNCIYPARWDSVIATAATGQNDNRASFSSTCEELELSAPGVSINSTMPGGGYATKSGTSMASPHVAGTAALARAANGGLTNTEVRNILRDTAENLGSTSHYGHGLVQALAASLAAKGAAPALPPTLESIEVSPAEATIASGQTQQFTATATYSDGSTADVTDGAAWASTNLDAASVDGNGLATGVGEGVAGITATLEEFSDSASLTVIAMGSISGTVTDAATGDPIAGALVQVDGTELLSTTGGDGTYTIADVPGGAYSVITSAGGYHSQTRAVDVAAGETTTVDLALQPVVIIDYSTRGGANSDRHLDITLAVVDGVGASVVSASVSIDLYRDGALYQSFTGTTGSDGTVNFSANNSPSGCYETVVTGVTADGLTWDGATPANKFCK